MLINMLSLRPTSPDLLPLGEKKVRSEGSKGAIFKRFGKSKKARRNEFCCPKSPNKALI